MKRRREHFCAARTNADKGRSRLYNAIRKHGQENFKFSVLENCDTYVDALRREIELISELSPSYNITKGGQGTIGTRITEDGRRRLSEAAKSRPGHWRGKKRDPETIEKIRAAKLANPQRYWLGKNRDAATIEKISNSKIGVKRINKTESETAARKRNAALASQKLRKPVICVESGMKFDSAVEASRYFGWPDGAVSQAITRTGHVRGIKFERAA